MPDNIEEIYPRDNENAVWKYEPSQSAEDAVDATELKGDTQFVLGNSMATEHCTLILLTPTPPYKT